MSDDRSAHLVERAAARLRTEAGIAAPAAPPVTHEPTADVVSSPAVSGQIHPTESLRTDLHSPPVSLARLVDAGLVVGGARNRTTEEYRVCVGRLVRNLRQLRAGAAYIVMVTSPRPGEGK
jgi:hypothetical protein